MKTINIIGARQNNLKNNIIICLWVHLQTHYALTKCQDHFLKFSITGTANPTAIY